MELSPSQFVHRKSQVRDYPFHMCTRNYPTMLRNNPHPYNVRTVKGFLGLPTQMVETEDTDAIAARLTVEQYVKDSLKRGDWNYKEKSNGYVKKTKDLDSILALQYFTGLQSFSFKEDYLPYLGYREYFKDWRRQLRNITEATYQPFLDASKPKDCDENKVQHPNEWLNDNKLLTRSKSMYSETGRLTTRESRTNTCTARRLHKSSRMPTPNTGPSASNINELDAVVFMLLADLLQTQSVHLIQSWLSRSTDRERALITSMLQSALTKPVAVDVETEMANRNRVKTSETRSKTSQSALQTVVDNSALKTEESNVLVVESTEIEEAKIEEIRPPTSSTFNNSTVQIESNTESKSRMKSRDSDRGTNVSMWSQHESIKE